MRIYCVISLITYLRALAVVPLIELVEAERKYVKNLLREEYS